MMELQDQVNKLRKVARTKELLRRVQLVVRALNLLAALQSKIARKNGTAKAFAAAAKAASAASAAAASFQIALSYLVDDALLQALLDDLEIALEQCETELSSYQFEQAKKLNRDMAALRSLDTELAATQSYLI